MITNNSDIQDIMKPEEYIKFVEFMTLPLFLRKEVFRFETATAFAKKYNVCPDTLTDWKRRDGFWDRVKRERPKWVKERASEVLASLYRKAISDGSASEVKLFLQYAGEFEESQVVRLLEKEPSEEEKELIKKALSYGKYNIEQNNTGQDKTEVGSKE